MWKQSAKKEWRKNIEWIKLGILRSKKKKICKMNEWEKKINKDWILEVGSTMSYGKLVDFCFYREKCKSNTSNNHSQKIEYRWGASSVKYQAPKEHWLHLQSRLLQAVKSISSPRECIPVTTTMLIIRFVIIISLLFTFYKDDDGFTFFLLFFFGSSKNEEKKNTNLIARITFMLGSSQFVTVCNNGTTLPL